MEIQMRPLGSGASGTEGDGVDTVQLQSLEKIGAATMSGMFDWITFERGKARFCGTERGGDELGHDVFAVQLNGPLIYHGEFKKIWNADETHFDIEIVSFGYGNAGNVGNPSPTARLALSAPEIAAAKSVITDLFRSDRPKPFPLNHMANLLKNVEFRPGWFREG
jgi:hypothetical protein